MPATATPEACALASGAASVTLGAGAAGAGVTIVAIVAVSWPAPVSISSESPTPRLAVLARRTPVAPAAEAAPKVVFAVAPREKLPELSTAR